MAIDHTCEVCGKDDDLMVGLTDNKVCGKCTRKAHSKVTGNKKSTHPYYKKW